MLFHRSGNPGSKALPRKGIEVASQSCSWRKDWNDAFCAECMGCVLFWTHFWNVCCWIKECEHLGGSKFILINTVVLLTPRLLMLFHSHPHQFIFTLFPCILPNAAITAFQGACFTLKILVIDVQWGLKGINSRLSNPGGEWPGCCAPAPLCVRKVRRGMLWSRPPQGDHSPARVLHGCTPQRKGFPGLINIGASSSEEHREHAEKGWARNGGFSETEQCDKKRSPPQHSPWRAEPSK